MRQEKIVGLIPARGGSKGIPKKNIVKLHGKPLIWYSIRASMESKKIDYTVVTTDDEEIMKISKKYGAYVIKRPRSLASDKASLVDVAIHAIDHLKTHGIRTDILVLLQPTSPLRTAKDIDLAIKEFVSNKNALSLVSVTKSRKSPLLSLKINKRTKYLEPLLGWEYFLKRRQELKDTYFPNGAIYIIRPKTLEKERSFYTKKTIPFIMPYEKSIDIDDELDLKLAEMFLKMVKCNERD